MYMLRILYKYLCVPSGISNKKKDDEFICTIKYIHRELFRFSPIGIQINMGDKKYKLDNISKKGFNIVYLQNEIIELLYEYQYIIQFENNILHQYYSEIKLNNYIKINDIHEKLKTIWIREAILYIDQNREIVIPKLMEVYCYLNYHFNFPSSNTEDKILNEYFYYETFEKNVFINNYDNEKITLEEVLIELFNYQDGMYNDNKRTRNWGLYRSSFYNIIMFKILNDTIIELGKSFNIDFEIN